MSILDLLPRGYMTNNFTRIISISFIAILLSIWIPLSLIGWLYEGPRRLLARTRGS